MKSNVAMTGGTAGLEKKRKKGSGLQRRNSLIAMTFIAPNFIGFFVLTLVPVLFSFALSVMEWDSANPMVFVGLENFRSLFSDKTFEVSFWNTLLFAAVTVPSTMVLSLAMAVILNQPIRGRVAFRSLFFFPYVASLVAISAVWNMLFHPEMGPVNSILHNVFGIANPPRWSADIHWALPTVMMMNVWKTVGYFMVIYLAALQGIPRELYEAALIDGASVWQRLRRITLPMLTPTTFFVMVMLFINAFKVFDQVYMVTQGGPGRSSMVLVYHIYNTAFIRFKFGYSSAMAVVLFVVVLAITIVQFRVEKRFVDNF